MTRNWGNQNSSPALKTKLGSDQTNVAEKLNTFYINFAEIIGINANVQNGETHKYTRLGLNQNFDFTSVPDTDIKKCIKKQPRLKQIYKS